MARNSGTGRVLLVGELGGGAQPASAVVVHAEPAVHRLLLANVLSLAANVVVPSPPGTRTERLTTTERHGTTCEEPRPGN